MRTLPLLLLVLLSCGSQDTSTDVGAGAFDASEVVGDTLEPGPEALVDERADDAPSTGPEPTVTLPAACGVNAPQFCDPLDGRGCGAGETCDLAGDGTWQCAPLGDPVGAGYVCDGLVGPYCRAGLTCVRKRADRAVCARLCCGDEACQGSPCRPLHAVGASAGAVGVCASGEPVALDIGNHPTIIEGRGHVVTWTTWRDALAREMEWYATTCEDVGGYPLLASATHYGGDCNASGSKEVIAALQNGTGILSYLAYDAFTGHADPRWLATARRLGDYLVDEAVTPDEGLWPLVYRSTGHPMTFPQPPDCGIRSDQPYEIEPDKIGIAGYALVRLSEATGEPRYAASALHAAMVLAANIVEADGTKSPWPFRVDWRDGSTKTPVSGNMSYNLRLFDVLLAAGHTELQPARDELWTWIRDVQIPNAATDGKLWVQFFENHVLPFNRTAWSPLALASYLLEKRDALDPDWKALAGTLLDFVEAEFVDPWHGFPVCIEQDFDRKPYGGILSTYAAVAARWAALTGDIDRRDRAYADVALLIQAIGADGCTADMAFEAGCGGWQQDAHTDKVHNVLTVLEAFPGWAD